MSTVNTIMNNLATGLTAIAPPTYTSDVKKVYRFRVDDTNRGLEEFPSLTAIPDGELTPLVEDGDHFRFALPILIQGFYKHNTPATMRAGLMNLLSDVKKYLYPDQSGGRPSGLGTACLSVRMVNVDTMITEDMARFDMHCILTYVCDKGAF